MNLQEDYCSSEIVKLLREKGFKCGATYSKGFVKDGDGFVGGLVRHEDKITHQMAMKWMREVHNIHIAIDRGIEHYFAVLTKLKPYQDLTMKNDVFDTYEEAVEVALKYCLTKVI